ncbi:MAG: DNA translocase FtsK 4TM domain-containing protein [Acidobacteriota bacterium]
MAKRRSTSFTRSIKRKTAQTKRKTVSTRRKTSGTQRAAKTASRATPTRRKSPKATSRFSPEAFLSGHKRELIGVTLMALGALTVVAALSSGAGFTRSPWLRLLSQAFGWGAFFFPLLLIGIGLLLVWRNLPTGLDLEGYVGLSLLMLITLAIVHALLGASTPEEGLAIAREGRGGGVVGSAILFLLVGAFGGLGAVVATLALLIVGLSLTLGTSISDLFSSLLPGLNRARERVALLLRPSGSRKTPEQPPIPTPHTATAPTGVEGLAGNGFGQAYVQNAQSPQSAQSSQGAQVWTLPQMEDLLEVGSERLADDEFDRKRATLIEDTLRLFGAPSKVVAIHRGPTITQFGVEPEFVETRGGRRTKVKVSKVAALADDLALALAARSIRIEAPVPGKGYIGIEAPNPEISLVALRDVMASGDFQKIDSLLRLGLGQDVSGRPVAADLVNMPHLLIAGTTGSGKSVCVNALIACLLLQNTPQELRLLMIDPKRVELTSYNGIPHLLVPVIVDLERVVPALQWISREMDRRYDKFSKEGVRNITDYNDRMGAVRQDTMPSIAVIIDELADLMMMAPDETERVVTRLAQLARATGIHLIIATQRPSVDVVTGIIKANFPARIAFAVASSVDSRVIIDQPGAERLLGKGDMLYQAPDAPAPVRMQGSFVSERELGRIIRYWKQAELGTGQAETDVIPPGAPLQQAPLWEEMTVPPPEQDELFEEAVTVVRKMRRGSISLLQRRLRVGYTRAARLVDQLEEAGIVGPAKSGSAPREILDYGGLSSTPTGDVPQVDAPQADASHAKHPQGPPEAPHEPKRAEPSV